MTISRKLNKKPLVIVPVAASLLGAGILLDYANYPRIADGWDPGGAKTAQEISRGESPGEHGPGSERGVRGDSGASGSEEASGAILAPSDTFDAIRSGARLFLYYDAGNNAFVGTVEDTTGNVLSQVRIEVHLSNGTELGPTIPVDMAPGQVTLVNLPATPESFTGWIAHAEIGGNAEGSQDGGEGVGEHGGNGGESVNNEAAQEAAMSSPITPLDQPWNGVLGGLVVSARYDAATQSVIAAVQNTLSQTQCYVQVEPHPKSGTQTVGELGPDVLGDLSPGQQAISTLSVAGEPSLAGVVYDGYVVHLEAFDCGGPGPMPHTGGEGAEGSGGEGHGPGGEGSSSESGASGSEEGSGANLALDETFDAVRGGARLILNYDAPGNSFVGVVENTTGNVLSQVRVEVHLSNGTELGPTNPVDLAPGQTMLVNLPTTEASFTGWIARAEVGGNAEGSLNRSQGEIYIGWAEKVGSCAAGQCCGASLKDGATSSLDFFPTVGQMGEKVADPFPYCGTGS